MHVVISILTTLEMDLTGTTMHAWSLVFFLWLGISSVSYVVIYFHLVDLHHTADGPIMAPSMLQTVYTQQSMSLRKAY